MSLLRFANLRTIRSTIETLGGRFRRKADPGVRPLKTRRLLVDPLEERTLLSVSPADWAATQINQSVIDYLPGNGTIAGQSIAVDNDGDFVVVWTSYANEDGTVSEDGDIFYRMFDRDDVPLTDEIQVNTHEPGKQWNPAVAIDADGEFVVVWASEDQDPGGSDGMRSGAKPKFTRATLSLAAANSGPSTA